MRSAAMHQQFSLTNTFARCFHEAARAERRLKDENRIAAARLGFDQFARRFAADFLVRGPEEDKLLSQTELRILDRLERKKRLNNACLHVEDPGAVGSAAGDAERHFR